MLIDDVMTIKEACQRWNLGNTTIRQACTGQKAGCRDSRKESSGSQAVRGSSRSME